MAHEVSLIRLYVMRALYLLNFALLGSDVWPAVIRHDELWDPLPGVAYSFWAALSALSAVGIRYPLAMLPVLLLQLFYKIVWLAAVGLPSQAAGHPHEMTIVFAVGAALDLVVIPWPYFVAHYIRQSGDRWR